MTEILSNSQETTPIPNATNARRYWYVFIPLVLILALWSDTRCVFMLLNPSTVLFYMV